MIKSMKMIEEKIQEGEEKGWVRAWGGEGRKRAADSREN